MGLLRRLSIMTGAAGGVTGLALHAYALAELLEQADPSPEQTKRLAVGIALGIAGLAAAVANLASRPVSSTLLLSLGVLGFFPAPATWAPAGALMIVAAVLGHLDLRRASFPTPRRSSAPSPRPTIADPEISGLHWSVAPLFSRGKETLTVGDEAATTHLAVAASTAGTPSIASAPRTTCAADRATWGRGTKTLVIVAVAATAAVVVPLALWPQDPVAAAANTPYKASVSVGAATTTTASPTLTEAAVKIPTTTGAEGQEGSPAPSTTVVSTLTRIIGPVDPSDPDAMVLYSDVRFGLTLAVPAYWAELPASSLADYRPQTYHLASFADIAGPVHDAAYLNGMTIKVLAGSTSEDPPQELMRQTLQEFIDQGPASYDYFQVIENIHETRVGGVDSLAATVRVTWHERVMVKTVYVCIADHCLYQVHVQTDDVDWDGYQDCFETILGSFTFVGAYGI